ncbi:Trp biosynthesis-associated membrane protein [Gulosibacter sp. 10]|uniref:Trp biosynthesis-associated membrane protein n=1 Tax=Gulosibacter sp. 10 TaxID=1255570 RepID=UPI00097F5CB4|nr:Trp biosynthesis-associated membrane protein [Gulosibacter sp. 10]SJM53584.1 Tryptophan-associated membrane protein [Gulosibacter sp. 10]
MSGGRLKRLILLGMLASIGAAMLARTQTWAVLELHTSEFDRSVISNGGDPALAVMAFSLAGLAAIAALAIAGRGFRVVIGALSAVLGIGIAVAAGYAASEPAVGFVGPVRELSGITDAEGIGEIIAQGTMSDTVWPFVALAAGAVQAALGVLVVVTARRWPESARRYRRAALAPEGEARASTASDPVSQWDALSVGDDPTEDDAEAANPR